MSGWSTPIVSGKAGGANLPIHFTVDSTGADFGIALGGWDYTFPNAGGTTTVTDNKGNTWTPLALQTGNGYTTLWYTQGGTFGTGHQVNLAISAGSNPAYGTIVGAFFSGSKPSPFNAQSGTASIFNALSAQPGPGVTPSQPNELIITAISLGAGPTAGESGDPGVVSIDSGFTIIDHIGGTFGSNWAGYLAYKIAPGTSLVNPTWSWTNNSSYSTPMAAFLIPVTGGTGTLAFGPPTVGGSALFLTPTGPGALAFGPLGMDSSAALDAGLPLGRLRQFWTI